MGRESSGAPRATRGLRRHARRSLAVAVPVCCVVGLAGSPALGEGAPFPSPSSSSAGSPSAERTGAAFTLGGALVIQESPTEGEQILAGEHARLASPEAVAARKRSREEFERLGAARAAQVARDAFPGVVEQPAGGAPSLPAGEHIVRYEASNAAAIALPDGKHGVVESLDPIATPSGHGRFAPIDLALHPTGGGYAPANSDVALRISRHASGGVSMPEDHVSLTPVNAHGQSLGGAEGAPDGAAVFYANTQTDTDTLVKPTTGGFEIDSLLRSVDSPETLYFKVGMPAGAKLVSDKRPGGARVALDGRTIAIVAVPGAEDAAGTSVPLSLDVAGRTLVVTAKHDAGEYQYPIEVDPTVTDTHILFGRTWAFYTENASIFSGGQYELGKEEGEGLEDIVSSSIKAGERAFFYYATQGESRIYGITAASSFAGYAGGKMENVLGIENVHTATTENSKSWIENYSADETVCALSGCATGTVTSSTDKTEVFYQQDAREAGPYAGGTSKLTAATVDIAQEAAPSASFNTSEATLEGGIANGLYAGKWVNTANKLVEVGVNATDPGLGINDVEWHSPNVSGWNPTGFNPGSSCNGVQCDECYSTSCGANGLVAAVESFPEGEDTVEGTVKDPVGLSTTAKATIKVDNAAPYKLTLSGLPPWNEIAFGYYKFKVSANDGSGSTPSSGVASIAVSIDGKEVGKPNGSCSPGPCTATGEWTVNGEEYAAGKHTIVMTATDAAGNVAKEEATLTIHAAESKPAGPGSVELASGAFTLGATDASVGSPGGGLSVERSFNSRRVSAGVEGPFGPQWQGLSFGGDESLTKLSTGGVVFAAANGEQSLFTKEGSKFLPPAGDANLTLKEESSTLFTLTDQHGDVTSFSVPSGGSGTLLTPSAREEPGHAGVTKYTFQTVGGITEPTEALAPIAAGVGTCATLVKGCRALTFSYASSTTATGEAPAEWGEYKGRLAKISFTGYNPSSKGMQTNAVAQYSYDKQGRLRAAWDPQISPALKTLYGYDVEGHVTAVTEPGQQPWLLHYGTIEKDPSGGRLLSVTRPSASTAFGEDIVPASTEAPKLSTTSPVYGKELTVSTGAWSHSPLSYGYQWERCNSSGAECAIIPGAVDPGYTPRYGDEEHTLKVVVAATNAGGSSTAATAASAVVPAQVFTPTYSMSFGSAGSGEGQFKSPSYVAIGDNNEKEEVVYVTDTGNNRVEIFSVAGKFSRAFGSAGTGEAQFKEPTGIAADHGHEGDGDDVWIADSGNKRVKWYLESQPYHSVSLEAQGGTLGGISALAGEWYQEDVVNGGRDFVQKLHTGETKIEYGAVFGKAGTGNGEFSSPSAVATTEGKVYVTDTGNNRVQEFNIAGIYGGQFGSAGTGNGQFTEPKGVAVDSSGNIWVVDAGNDRVEGFTSAGKYLTQFGTKGEGEGQFKEPVGIAVDSSNNLYIVDKGNNRVEKWLAGKRPAETPLPPATPPTLGASAVETIDYQVPLSGSGAPDQLSSTETAKWGQTDDPVEATAIFPPDEPMGWPAKDYKRATVYYRDSKDRTVNTAAPSGAIGTTEYNTNDDVVRTLSPDNRAAALKEGSKSAEVSKLLDSESTYNSEGTELQSTLGPQHIVKLASGSTVEARDHEQYYYEEGAPSEGGPYRLVTKVTDGAQYSGKEEDMRTTTTSYSGQENLGWKLRKPTSVTTDPNGLKLTHTIVYEAATGNVLEATTPTGSAGNPPPAYANQFGAKGSGAGQLASPVGDAIDAHGDVWVADLENNRIDEFSSAGAFTEAVGFGVGSKGEEKLETCTSSCKAGKAGSGNGQFSEPKSIAVSGGDLYVADYINDRIEEFNEKGEYVAKFGSKGEGAGQISGPLYVAAGSTGDIWVADLSNSRLDEFSSSGTFVQAVGFGVSNGEAKLQVCTSTCKAGIAGSGNGQFSVPQGIAAAGGDLYVADFGNDRVEELTEKGEYVSKFGSKGTGNGQFQGPVGIATSSPTGDLYVTDVADGRVEEFTASGAYLSQFGSKGSGNGQLKSPEGIAVNSSGDIYVVDDGNDRVEQWVPNSGGAHTSQTIYYTTAANSKYPACGEHPEWANLPCQTQPAEQPETSGLPNLPVTTVTYNMWDEPEKITETVGTTTRTKTATYEASGRLEKSAISSTVGTALPTVTDAYNKETGELEKQSTTTEGKTETITNVYNTLGELTSYTDGDEGVTTYEYDIDGRIKKDNDGKGAETYTYNETTGLVTELLNEYGTTKLPFKATYDIEGNMLTEGYPNGMNADYTYNQEGTPTKLEYVKTTHCTEKCTWFSDAVVPSIHGQWLEQTSTLSHQAYTYDAAGRLTQVQDTPTGKGCTTRMYAYDEDTNRVSLKTYEPNSKGECASEAVTEESHTYDSADRLDDAGVKYSEFGNITNVPASDAGGSELTSTFYTDNQLASETQNGQTIGYNLDPAGRTRETVMTGKRAETVVSHYAGPGSAPAWTVNTSGETTRNIGSIGGFAAVQYGTETPVLQLSNLHGDVIATAADNETETKLLSTADTSEYGVPTTSAPPKYSWLGAAEIPTELPSGVLDMGARSYVPQLGRFLQPDPRPGGSANSYSYTFGDPVNSSDPSGEYTIGGPSQALISGTSQMAGEAAAQQAAENAAARAEAERKAEEAEEAATAAAGPQYEGEEEEWEEEGEEYVAYHHGSKVGGEEAHAEAPVFDKPLGEATESMEGGNEESQSAATLCKAGSEGPCARFVRKKARCKVPKNDPDASCTCPKGATKPCDCIPSRGCGAKSGPTARPGTGTDERNRKEAAKLECSEGLHPATNWFGEAYCQGDGSNASATDPWEPEEES
jgi:RHS repeat-associated protein